MGEKIKIENLKTADKIKLLVGKDAWHTWDYPDYGIPSLAMADGPHGLRKVIGEDLASEKTVKAVCYPSLVTLASSFDKELAFKMGKAIASEFKAENTQLILAPGMNIKRNPLGGRNFEYFSEDPLLTARLASGFVTGAKSENVGVCLKHFALNNQESYRMYSDSTVDERAKYEIYLKAFREVVALKPEMVMCSYNKVDGINAAENIHLLKEILRAEFGFDGVIVSDWTAVKDRTKSLFATLDLEMPGYVYGFHKLLNDYNKGLVPLELIDESVSRLLKLIDKFKDFEPRPVDLEANHELSRNIAGECFVLLKNSDNLLPINEKDDICLIGAMAETVRYQGGGSSHVNSYQIDNIKDALAVEYAPGYSLKTGENEEDLFEQAIELAKKKDKVIVVAGLTPEYESEGYDREHLDLPANQLDLIDKLAEVNENIIVILQIGSPVVMPFFDKVKSILNVYLAGEAIGKAVCDVICGKVNPSGRLAETFPISLDSLPNKTNFATGNNQLHYKESVFVGYRYFETFAEPVLFPFGYGLSYTKFKYENLKLSKTEINSEKNVIDLSVDVTNTGKLFGKEVVQLYFENVDPKLPRPKRELIDFAKIGLEPGETKTVEFQVGSENLSYFNPDKHEFITDDGTYKLQICKNAHEVILEQNIKIVGTETTEKNIWHDLKSYNVNEKARFSDADFAKLIRRPLGKKHVIRKRPYDINNNLEDIEKTLIGGLLVSIIVRKLKKEIKNQPEDFKLMLMKNFKQWPIRSLVLSSGGKISMHKLMFVLELINFRILKAIRAFFTKD